MTEILSQFTEDGKPRFAGVNFEESGCLEIFEFGGEDRVSLHLDAEATYNLYLFLKSVFEHENQS